MQVRVEVAAQGSAADMVEGVNLPWVDITDRVRLDVNCRRGRTGADEASAAGTLRLTLSNDDGVFTPGRAGDLAGWLADRADDQGVVLPQAMLWASLRDRPIRVSVDVSGWVPVWTGIVTSVRVSWRGGATPEVDVSAVDAVAMVKRWTLEALPVQAALAYRAAAVYGLRDEGGPAQPAEVGAPLRLTPVGSGWDPDWFGWGVGAAPGARISDPEAGAAAWSGTTASAGWCLDSEHHPMCDLPAGGATPDGLGRYATTLTVTVMPADVPRDMCAAVWQMESGHRVEVGVTAAGFVYVAVGELTTVTTAQLTRGVWSHVAVTGLHDYAGTDVEVWVDGVAADAFGSAYDWRAVGARRWRVGASLQGATPRPWDGRIADVAVFDRILGGAEIADLSEGVHGWAGESSTARVVRLLRFASRRPGVPAASTPGLASMCAQHGAGRSAGDLLDECVTAERSGWWAAADGTVAAGSRADRWWPVAALTVDASQVGSALSFEADNAERITSVAATRPGGARAAVRSRPAVDGIEFHRQVTLLVDSDAQVEEWAAWAMSLDQSEPPPSSDALVLELDTLPGVAADAIACGPGSVVTLSGLPAAAPGGELRLLVLGVEDRVSPSGWVRTFHVAAAGRAFAPWRLGVSELGVGTWPAP